MNVPSAIPLLTWDSSSHKFLLNSSGLSFIRTLPSPLAVISVAGMYRTGKSYLLNRVFLNRSQAFEVGPSVNPCTKGIWIWGESISGTTEEGIPCTILIVDTEGMGGLEKDTNYDSRIFSIASLISSCFVYNSTGSIDENAIEGLGLIVNISKLIQTKDPISFFPKFLWVVRDFTLQLIEDDGRTIAPNEYLEKALQQQKGNSESVENKNKIRRALTSYFRERECVTLVRPTIDEKDLQHLDELETHQLRSEFMQQVVELRRRVLCEAKPKKVNGQEVTGEILVGLLENYVEAFNSGAVPNIDIAWNYICKAQNKKVVEKAVAEYGKMVNEVELPVGEVEFRGMHRDAREAGVRYLEKNIVGQGDGIVEEFKKMIRQKLEESKEQNKYQLKMHYMTYLKEKYNQLDSAIKAGEFSNMQILEKMLKNVEKEYYEDCLDGQSKAEIYLSFAREISNKACDYIIAYLQNEIKLQKNISTEQISKLSADLGEASSNILKIQTKSDKQLSELQGELSTVVFREEILKEQIVKVTHAKEEAESNLKELNKQRNLDLEEFKRKYTGLEVETQNLIRKKNSEISEIEDQKALILQKLEFTENSLEDYRNKEKTNSEKIKELRQENSQAVKSIQSKYEMQIEKLNERISEKTRECSEIENEIELKEALLEETQACLNEMKKNYEEFRAKTEQEIETLAFQIQEKEIIHAKKIEKMEQEFKTSTARIRARLNETEKKLRNSEELLRNDMAIWAQDNAILVQKIEFLEQEVDEQKIKREDEKKHYLAVINTIEGNSH